MIQFSDVTIHNFFKIYIQFFANGIAQKGWLVWKFGRSWTRDGWIAKNVDFWTSYMDFP